MSTDKLLTLWTGLSTDQERAERLQAAEAIQQRIYWHETEVAKRETKHKQEMAELNKRRLAIQAECPHWLTTYHPDAAGGSDSWTDCDLCGAEMTREMLSARFAATADGGAAPDAGGPAAGMGGE